MAMAKKTKGKVREKGTKGKIHRPGGRHLSGADMPPVQASPDLHRAGSEKTKPKRKQDPHAPVPSSAK